MPIDLGSCHERLTSLDFELYHIDAEKKEIAFLWKNGRDIPNVYNSAAGCAVFVFRTNSSGKLELLIVNDLDKPFVNVVGGCINDLELVADGAAREVQEEIGLVIKPENLKLITLTNRLDKDSKTNRFGFFYVCHEFEGEPKPDGKEISDFKWVELEQVLSPDFECFGKKFNAFYVQVLTSACVAGKISFMNGLHKYSISTVS